MRVMVWVMGVACGSWEPRRDYNCAVDALDSITASILDARASGHPPEPAALTLLVRRYAGSGRADLGDVLGPALTDALAVATADAGVAVRAAWLTLFAEVRQISDDERVRTVALDLIAGLRREWPSTAAVADAALAVEACLRAADAADPRDLVPAAIDELEHIVSVAYRPGEGMAHSLDGSPRTSSRPANHVRTASALLTAFDATGRLPYSMLAEELMQGLAGDWSAGADPALVCDAARVLCRLATLHDDAAYRAAAVVSAGANYRRDAEVLLAPLAQGAASTAAVYGLALMELR